LNNFYKVNNFNAIHLYKSVLTYTIEQIGKKREFLIVGEAARCKYAEGARDGLFCQKTWENLRTIHDLFGRSTDAPSQFRGIAAFGR